MKVHSLEIKGIGRFHEPAAMPVHDLNGAGIVAVHGLNGAGKTTLIECIPGIVYGSVPSHGLLSAMANAADSYVEAVVETDQIYRLRRTIKATLKTPKIEAYITDGEFNPLNDGKQTTFAQEIARRFPSERVYLASGFAAQNRGGQFLQVSKAERRVLFAEMLGLVELQRLSEAAASMAVIVGGEIAVLRAKCEAHEAKADKVTELLDRVDYDKAALSEVTEQRERIEVQTREAESSMAEWKAEDDRLVQAAAEVAVTVKDAEHGMSLARGNLHSARHSIAQAEKRRESLQFDLDGRDQLETKAARLDGAKAELEQLRAEAKTIQRNNEQREKASEVLRQLTQDLERAERQAEHDLKATHGLADVPCGGEGEFASCALISKAVEARDRADKNAARVDKARLAVDGQRECVIKFGEPTSLEPLYDKMSRLSTEERRAKDAADGLLKLDTKAAELDEVCRQLAEMGKRLDEMVDNLETSKNDLAQAKADLDEAKRQVAKHREDRPLVLDSSVLAALHDDERELIAKVAKTEAQLAEATEARAAISGTLNKIAEKNRDLDDWRHLAKALGRDGIQALEVDAAGPEVSDLINDLLHSCYGARFTCSLQTTALKKDGKGTKEVFDLRVIDTEMGTDGSASDLSGGERVIVAESLGLAIAIYNARQSSVPILDLFRDECAGALDYQNAPRYVAMLRRALELGGFHRVYFIAHQRELWDLADARIVVSDGKAEVR